VNTEYWQYQHNFRHNTTNYYTWTLYFENWFFVFNFFANAASSIKPEVHNISQLRDRRTERWPEGTLTKIRWRSRVHFRRFFSLDHQTDRQTDTAVAMLRCPIGGGLSDKIIHEVWRVDRAKQMSRVRHRHCISDVIASLSGDSARRCDFRV